MQDASKEAPRKFHFWSAAALLGASLKRHCWIDRRTYKLYPNQYVVLVGPPVTGKGAALNPIMQVAKAAGTVNVLSDRLTVPYIIERMSKGFSSIGITATGGAIIGNDQSGFVFATELPVLLANPLELKDLSDLWDSREHPFEYGTRGKGLVTIDRPCVNLLGGITPAGIVDCIPLSSISNGFTSRINFIWAPGREDDVPWPDPMPPDAEIIDDLRYIATNVHGEFTFDKDAKRVFEKLYMESRAEDVEEEAISHYKGRKWTHAAKLSMIISASRNDSRIIEGRDIQKAGDEIDGVISELMKVFKRIGESDLLIAGQRVSDFIEAKGYASRSEILRALWRHVTGDDLTKILIAFCEAGLILEKPHNGKIVYQVNTFAPHTKGGTP